MGVGSPRIELQEEPITEGGAIPSADTWGVLLGGRGAGIDTLRKPGVKGGPEPCTGSRVELVDVGGPGTDTRGWPSTAGGVDSGIDPRGGPEGGAGPGTGTRGWPASGLEAGAAPAAVLRRVADMGIWWFRPWASKPQRPILESVLVLGPGLEPSWAGAPELFSYPGSALDAFDRKLENGLEKVRHSERMLDPDAEDVAAPKLESGSEIWAAVPPAPGARSASRPLSPPPPREAAELFALMVLERAGGEPTFCSPPLPHGRAPRQLPGVPDPRAHEAAPGAQPTGRRGSLGLAAWLRLSRRPRGAGDATEGLCGDPVGVSA